MLISVLLDGTTSFITPTSSVESNRQYNAVLKNCMEINACSDEENTNNNKRRQLIFSSLFSSTAWIQTLNSPARADIEGVVTPSEPDANPIPSTLNSSGLAESSKSPKKDEGVVLYTTKSGLKYIDLIPSTIPNAPKPRYGQFCTISYTAYVKLPDKSGVNSKLQKYDSDPTYLIKHGNGRILPGLDEGIHTMALGSKRRIIIPPKLGYVGPGVLGPLPEGPFGRYKLNKLLDEMIELRGGNIVMDIELKSILDDEADQGYYDDDSLSPDDFNTLRNNLQQSANKAKMEGRKSGAAAEGILNSLNSA
eukprot:CAMPEP_0184867182 /NCGR_PEP_ID=MMETSP0580-20130426/25320_1 /TAXON_ID=1118495 /ORGANISM="Dactyliosolen fragilissimus" /LENGTH=306 /DNA_ID=CAMNT_0027367279 /DNA_START=1 /DNA_END=921 /DNA_ORIENTATION=+